MRLVNFKRLLIISVIFFAVVTAYSLLSQYQTPPKVTLQFKINILASNLYVLDQVANSTPHVVPLPIYDKVLKNYFKDTGLLKTYNKLRLKYQNTPKDYAKNINHASGIFTPSPEQVQDPICDAFFNSITLEEAINKLDGVLDKNDLLLLKQVFDSFASDFAAINKNIMADFSKATILLNTYLKRKEITTHLTSMYRFFNTPLRPFKSLVILWNPLPIWYNATLYGDHLIVTVPSAKVIADKPDLVKMLVSSIINVATQHIASSMAQSTKTTLSKDFLENITAIKENNFLMSFEGPLLMASQMIFVQKYYSDIYEKNPDWFNQSLDRYFAPLLQNYLHNQRSIDKQFMLTCAALYQEYSHYE